MLISGKGKYFSVFGCISKNFPENIFWCLEKKKENTNPEKHKPQPRKNHQRRQAIVIDGAISLSVDRNLGSSFLAADCDQRRDLAVRRFSSRARVLSLSLSLSFSGNALKGKQKCKLISVVKGIFFGSTDFNFRKIEFSGPTKQPHFWKSISGSDFHPKQTQPYSVLRKLMCISAFLATISQLFRYSLTREKHVFSVFNVANVTVFHILSFPSLSLS